MLDDFPSLSERDTNLPSCSTLILVSIRTFGWTFFKLLFQTNLQHGINQRFSDMIVKAKGRNPDDKFTNFLSDYFESRGCKVRLKLIDA